MSAVIYIRQSLDRDGKGAAVERQLKACREFCAAKGWIVSRVFEDNDISATSGKRRPAFEALLASNPERIVVWHIDRLIRLSRELERVIDLGVNVHAVKSGHIDLSNPAGRAVAKTVTAWAQYEGEQKATRQIASNIQRASNGVWQFSNRPYGYERVNGEVQIVEDEAAIIREAYERYLVGDTYYAIVDDLNTRGVPTIKGKPWTMTQLRERLANPAYAGIRTYKGDVVSQGNWEPIITLGTWERFNASKMRRKTRHDWSNHTKHLLSGIIFCGVCSSRMLARPEYGRKQADGTKRVTMTYQCTTNWCVSRNLERVDEVVQSVIIARLSNPDTVNLVKPKMDVQPLIIESHELRQRRDDLATALAEGALTLAAVRSASETLDKQIKSLQERISAAEGDSQITSLMLADDVSNHWHTKLTLAQRRAIIATLARVTINKQANTRVFNPEDVAIEWLS
jgi:site-specific DNA recombinase